MYCVYKISNSANDKLYIGMSNNVEQRWKSHQSTARQPNHKDSQKPLYVAMRELGIDKFSIEVIEKHPDWQYILRREQYWTRKLSTRYPDGYNWKTSQLSDEEAAIIRYDAYNKSMYEYAQMFGTSVQTVRLIQSSIDWRPYKYLTIEDLPAHLTPHKNPPDGDGRYPYDIYTFANSLTSGIFWVHTTRSRHLPGLIQAALEGRRTYPELEIMRSIWQQEGKIVIRKVKASMPYAHVPGLDMEEAMKLERQLKIEYGLIQPRKRIRARAS